MKERAFPGTTAPLLAALFILLLPHTSGGRSAAQPPAPPTIDVEFSVRLTV